MKENFPNLAKEIDFQEVQQAQRIPKKLDLRRNTPRHIIIKLPKIKDKERILKAGRGKERELPTKEFPLDYQLISQKKPCRQKRSIQSLERQEPTTKITLSSKAII